MCLILPPSLPLSLSPSLPLSPSLSPSSMSDSDGESYEVIDGRLSPSVRGRGIQNKRHIMSRDQRKSSSHSPAPRVGDIDFRPPYPTPKCQSLRSSGSLSTSASSQLTYDRITLSPVVPDYETTSSSCSPPPLPLSSSIPNGHGSLPDTPPPLPPLNSSQKWKYNRYSLLSLLMIIIVNGSLGILYQNIVLLICVSFICYLR